MTAPLPQVERLMDRYAQSRRSILRELVALLERLFARVNPYDGDQAAQFARQAAQASRAAQTLTARATEAHLRGQLQLLEVEPSRTAVRLPSDLRGIPLERVYERPARAVRYLESVETPPDEARRRAGARLILLADDDVQMAAREATREVLADIEQAIGYRRVLRPELSESGPCGLCIVASDRLYSKADLLPIHERCKCVTLPVTSSNDPGVRINSDDLKRIYEAAGGTEAARLKRVRVEVHEHGELGPVLRRAGNEFRAPRDAARAPRKPAAQRDLRAEARAEIAALEQTYARLQQRAEAGEDVAGPLAYQRARLDLLRSRLT